MTFDILIPFLFLYDFYDPIKLVKNDSFKKKVQIFEKMKKEVFDFSLPFMKIGFHSALFSLKNWYKAKNEMMKMSMDFFHKKKRKSVFWNVLIIE